MTYTARHWINHNGIDKCVRWKYTVDPGYDQTYYQPAEHATIDIKSVMVGWPGNDWHANTEIIELAYEELGGDDAVHEWLMSEADDYEQSAEDDAADHKREMQREDMR